MRIWKGNIMHIDFMATVFTAWDYDLSFLESIAFLASVVAIGLAIAGWRRWQQQASQHASQVA